MYLVCFPACHDDFMLSVASSWHISQGILWLVLYIYSIISCSLLVHSSTCCEHVLLCLLYRCCSCSSLAGTSALEASVFSLIKQFWIIAAKCVCEAENLRAIVLGMPVFGTACAQDRNVSIQNIFHIL